MKANNAPERLYLSKIIYSTFLYQVPDPDDETAVEYTRTDVFIEKACEWLKNHNNYQRVLDNRGCVRFDMTQCVIDFRKAIKGE